MRAFVIEMVSVCLGVLNQDDRTRIGRHSTRVSTPHDIGMGPHGGMRERLGLEFRRSEIAHKSDRTHVRNADYTGIDLVPCHNPKKIMTKSCRSHVEVQMARVVRWFPRLGILRGVPACDIIDFDVQDTYWHMPQDTLEKVDPRSLAIVGQVFIEVGSSMQKHSK